MTNDLITTASVLNVDMLKEAIFQVFRNDILPLINCNSIKEEPEKELVSSKEICELLNISNVTLWNWKKQGKFPSYRIGTKVYFKKEEVLNALSKVQNL